MYSTFEDIENIGVECTPKCGSCRCGNCNPGKKEMTLPEEEELNRIKGKLQYIKENSRWQVEIPCNRNLNELPNNKFMAVYYLWKNA